MRTGVGRLARQPFGDDLPSKSLGLIIDLAAFVAELCDDLRQNPGEWENTTLERFLEALSRYLEDLPGWCQNCAPDVDADEPRWRLFAQALIGAAVYE